MWFGAAPLRIAESLAAALFTTLTPEFVCAICAFDEAGPPGVIVQTGRYESDPELAAQLTPALLAWARDHDPDQTLSIPNPRGPGVLQVAVRAIGHHGEFGVLAAGFAEGRGPQPIHQLLLNVAATQAGAAVQNTRLVESLRSESQTLETLNRTGASLASEFDLAQVVQTVTDSAVQLIGAKFGAFFYTEMDDAGGSFMLYRLAGADPADFERFPHPRNTAVFEPTFKGEGIVRSPDITADPRFGKNPPYNGTPPGHLPVRSYLAVPVRSRSGDVIGGLFFGHPEVGVFAEKAERLVEGLAAQAAIALDNARLLQAVQRANQTLEERVRERTRELEAAHEALRQSQKMEAIGQLTGGIAHDFNNLLTVIRGSVDLLRREDLPETRRQRYVDAISETVDRASKLTGQLLAFARRQVLAPEVFDVGRRIRDVAEMLRSVLGARVEVVIEGASEPAFIRADPAQFETTLVNLAVNARDAMDGEGRLTIRIGSAAPAGQKARRRSKGYVSIEVMDTGRGIHADHLDRIFEPFFTTKEVGKGTGLGLSQVYGFVQQSGGTVEVRSAPDEGAAFTLYLPATSEPETQESASPLALDDGAPASGHVLVVEDNADVREFADRLLRDLGFRTTCAASALEALETLETRADTFDVVFSDVVMPGMGGVDFADQVKDRWPGLPVVLTSGYSHVLAEKNGHDVALLHKPYSAEALSRALREAMASRRPTSLAAAD